MRRARYAALVGLLAALVWVATAHAYTLSTTTSESCHERLTAEATDAVLRVLDAGPEVVVPDDAVLRRLLKAFVLPGTERYTDVERFVLLSLVIGVRSPDTEGHSVLNLSALRRLHADRDPVGQYAHALRGPADDGLEGDLAAVRGTLAIIQNEIDAAGAETTVSSTAERPVFLEHYGVVQVPVLLGAWHLGRAVHALQDAHAHMLWDAEVKHVLHVLNYVEAVEGTLRPSRDGLPHSGALDDCNRRDTAPMVERARARTTALIVAATAVALDPTNPAARAPLALGLSPCPDAATDPAMCGWLVYNPPCAAALDAKDADAREASCCTGANAYCGSPYLSIARKDPAGPYLGCAQVAAAPRPAPAAWMFLAMIVWGLHRALRAHGGRRWWAATLVATFTCGRAHAEADHARPPVFVQVEGSGSALDDTTNSALLAPTLGVGLRVGIRQGDWRFGLHLERSWWVALEYGVDLEPGVVNVALAAEYLYFDDFVRSAVALGVSVLQYDTVLDDAGTAGFFVEARPAGLRWALPGEFHLTFDALSLAVMNPVVREPQLRKLARRTLLGIETTF